MMWILLANSRNTYLLLNMIDKGHMLSEIRMFIESIWFLANQRQDNMVNMQWKVFNHAAFFLKK